MKRSVAKRRVLGTGVRRIFAFVVFAAGVLLGLTHEVAADCGMVTVGIHHARTGLAGAFVINERRGAAAGPPIRFWAYGLYAKANNGSEGQWTPDLPWLSGGARAGAPPEYFFLFQASWTGQGIHGCIMDDVIPEPRRTVVELSYLFNENQPAHYTGCLIASVRLGSNGFDFDTIVDGDAGANVIRLSPIPPPRPMGAATASSNPVYMEVNLAIPEVRSHGDSGAPNLIRGYEIFYKNDVVPLTGDRGFYDVPRSGQSPANPLGLVPYGTPSVRVAVPIPKQSTYFVMRVVYADPSYLVSNGTSGNSDAVSPPGGGKGDEKSKASPTPTPGDAAATPSPVEAVTADAGRSEPSPGADGGVARPRASPVPAKADPGASRTAGAAPGAPVSGGASVPPAIVGSVIGPLGSGDHAPRMEGRTASTHPDAVARAGSDTRSPGGRPPGFAGVVGGIDGSRPIPGGTGSVGASGTANSDVPGTAVAQGPGGDGRLATLDMAPAAPDTRPIGGRPPELAAHTVGGGSRGLAGVGERLRSWVGGRAPRPVPAKAEGVSAAKDSKKSGLAVGGSLWTLLDLSMLLSLGGLAAAAWFGRRA